MPATVPSRDADQAALAQMLAGQMAAVRVVSGAGAAIVRGAEAMAAALRRGGRLHYAAAGSSGLMALADACELPGTFGIAQDRIAVHMAGGVPASGAMPGDTEDDAGAAREAASAVAAGDLAIVVSASGTTPYALAFAERARARGARVVALSGAASAPLLGLADIAVALPTGPEFLEGSTRLGAGTAQKVALNAMSTLMGIRLGHVHDGLMVNLTADNAKLRARATEIVRRVAGVPPGEAERALAATGHDAKAAILVARGLTPARAAALLRQRDGFLGACLAACDADAVHPTTDQPKGETS